MRMGAFLLGSFVGACAAMYLNRNNKGQMLSGMNIDQTIDKVGQITRTAKEMWQNTAVVGSNGAAADHSSSAGPGSGS